MPQADRPRAEEILLQRRLDDPGGPWSARLGRFYAASVVGHHVQITDKGPLREMTGFDPKSAFAAHARARLEESNDPVLLIAAAGYLRRAPHYGDSFSERDFLAKGYLERAVRLDPDSVGARAMLASVMSRERSHLAWRRDLAQGPVYHFEALAALPATERFEAMAEAAIDSQRSARLARQKNDRNMARYMNVRADNARRFAQEVLALGPRFENLPDAGLFVYQAHMTLASLAMLDGDTGEAVESLRQAALAPPAEGIVYGGRVAAWTVVRDLVEAGERAAVADFLEAMAGKSVVDRGRLLAAAGDVRDGQLPTRLFAGSRASP